MRLPIKPFASFRSPLWAILPAFVLMGVLYSINTPIFEASDELRHVAVVEYLWQGRGLPIQNPAHHEFFEQEGSQPPLYYFLAGLIAQPIGLSDFRALAIENPHTRNIGRADATDNRNMLLHTAMEYWPWRGASLFVHVMRLLGVMMGAITVACSWHIGLRLAPSRNQRSIASLSAALTAFNPMFLFISASVNNDNLVTMLASVAVLLALIALRNGATMRSALLLGCVLGGGALAKTSGLVPAVIIPGFLVVRALQTKPRTGLAPLVTMALLIALIAGWFYARNWLLYGEPTGTQMMVQIAGARDHIATAQELLSEWDGFYKAYWGLFGAVNIPMWDWVYLALTGLGGLAVLGLVIDGLACISRLRVRKANLHRSPATTLAVAMCVALLVGSFIAFLRWTSLTFASQGRLLFPVITIISVAFSIGLHTCLNQFGRLVSGTHAGAFARLTPALACILAVGMAALAAIAPIAFIRPAYAAPKFGTLAGEGCATTETATITCFVPVSRTEIRFGDAIRWVGFTTQPRYPQLGPGESLDITLYWQALKPLPKNYSLFIKLYDTQDNEVAVLDGTPGGGMWQTSLWRTGEVIADRYRLRLETHAPVPTVLRMDVGFYEFSNKQNLATFDGRGQLTGRQRFEVAALSVPIQSGATLSGASAFFAPNTTQPGRTSVAVGKPGQTGAGLVIPMTWLTTAPIPGDYTIFAQLYDEQNNLIGQADGRPVAGFYGTQWWQPGTLIADNRVFSTNYPLKPGRYTLRYGLYDAAQFGLPRVAAFTAGGAPAVDNSLIYEFDLP